MIACDSVLCDIYPMLFYASFLYVLIIVCASVVCDIIYILYDHC